MDGIIKKMFIAAIRTVQVNGCNTMKYVSMSNQKCIVMSTVVDININDLSFYPHRVTVNKCSGSYNDINNPYSKLCVPYVVKDVNIKVFNQMSKTIETGYISLHKICACKCRLDTSVCNDKQR